MSSLEIEDVLASIRRLVSEDLRPANRPGAIGKLLLTPALRVVSQTGVVDREDAPLDRAGTPAADAAVLRDDWVPDQSSLSAVEDHEADHLDFSIASQNAAPQRGPAPRTAMQMAAESFHAQTDEFILSYSDSGTLVLRGDPAGAEARGGTDHGAVFAALSKADLAAKIPPVEALADAEGGTPVEEDANWSTVDWDASPADADQANAPDTDDRTGLSDDAATMAAVEVTTAPTDETDAVMAAPVTEAERDVAPSSPETVSADTDARADGPEAQHSAPEDVPQVNDALMDKAPDAPTLAETAPAPPASETAPAMAGSAGPLVLPFVSARRAQGAEVLTLRRPLLQVIGVDSGTDAHDTLSAPLILRPSGAKPAAPDPEAAPANWPGEGDFADQDAAAAAAQFFRDAVAEGQSDGAELESNWNEAVVDKGPDSADERATSETLAPVADVEVASEEHSATPADAAPLLALETPPNISDEDSLVTTDLVEADIPADQHAEPVDAVASQPEPAPDLHEAASDAAFADLPPTEHETLPADAEMPDEGGITLAADQVTPEPEPETALAEAAAARHAEVAQTSGAVTATRAPQAHETTPILDTLGETMKTAAIRAKAPVNLGEAAFTRWPGWAQTDPDDAETVPSAMVPVALPPVPAATRKKPKAAVQDLGWADRAEAEIHRQLAAELGPSALSGGTTPAQGLQLSEAALRDLVRDLIREELTGKLGERITQNVRKLVQMELQKTMSLQVGEFRSQRRDPS